MRLNIAKGTQPSTVAFIYSDCRCLQLFSSTKRIPMTKQRSTASTEITIHHLLINFIRSPVISWGMIEHVYPRYPQIEDLELPDSVRDYWINITPYIDTTAYTLQDNASVQVAISVTITTTAANILTESLSHVQNPWFAAFVYH